jgi:ABC-type bacteriocin/lantibiotic exporter with double-glycine peptidase domain
MTIVPRVVSALSGFERIQAFLLRPRLEVYRRELSKAPLACNSGPSQLVTPGPSIRISEIQYGHPQVLLEDININIAAGTLNVISGPTGSGKSTLLRMILGEAIPTHGNIFLSTQRIAYCAQRPWLPNGTIKEAIYGATNDYGLKFEDLKKRYHEVLNMCCLTHDIDSLANGDQTQIGSRGLNLSGGQRQRVVSFSRLPYWPDTQRNPGTRSCIICKMRYTSAG